MSDRARLWRWLRQRRLSLQILLLLGRLHHQGVDAVVSSKRVTGSDLLLSSIMGPTGLAKGASLSVEWQYASNTAPSSSLVLVLVDSRQLSKYYKVTTDTEQQYLNVLCLSPSAIRAQLPTDATAGSMSFTVSHTEQYALLLLQCSRSYGGPVDLRVTAKAVNPNTRGQLVHFLGMEDVPMPKVYLGMTLASIALFLLWVANLLSVGKQHVTGLHVACAAALLVKVVEMGVQLGYDSRMDTVGTVVGSYRIANAMIQKLSLLSQMLVLFLISLGWKVTRPSLSPREMRLLLVAFGMYFCFAGSQATCAGDDTDGKLCEAYTLTEYVTHSLILLGIIVSINFNITHLRATLNDYPWSAAVPLQYAALKNFQFFRWAFLLYLLLPTILLITRIMLLSWAYNWLDQLLKEGAFLAIYVCIAVTFGPTSHELYTRPFAPSDSQAQAQPPQPPAGRGQAGAPPDG